MIDTIHGKAIQIVCMEKNGQMEIILELVEE